MRFSVYILLTVRVIVLITFQDSWGVTIVQLVSLMYRDLVSPSV